MNKVRYKKLEDPSILAMIDKTIERRPTYGYKRVTTMVSKEG